MHHLDVEVKVTAACDIGKQRKSEGIRTALRNAIRERSLLILRSLGDLILFKIASKELVMEGLKLDTVDDIQRVNDISWNKLISKQGNLLSEVHTKRLAHLPTLGITDQAVTVDFLERNLAREFKG